MINIVGDINFSDEFFDTGFGIGSKISKGENPFRDLSRREQDYWIGNCECVISDVTNKGGIYRNQFRITPSLLEHIRHFDLYGVANNHVMQHGEEAYQSMLDYLKVSNIAYAGAIEKKAHTFVHQGKKVGLLAFSQREEKYCNHPLYWFAPSYREIEQEVVELRPQVEYLIVFVHWGNEFINYPYRDQIDFAHWLVDIGVDLITGMHSHILQGYEQYHNGHIFYSLGNFVFNMPTIDSQRSCIVHVDLEAPKPKISYSYVVIGKDYFPRVQDSVESEYSFEHLNRLLRESVSDNEQYYDRIRQNTEVYRKANALTILKSFPKYNLQDIIGILGDYVKRRIL